MSNFKMKHQGVPALMKTLTAGQQGMIKSMKKSGKTAQAESIKKGIEDAPVKKEGKTLSPEEIEDRAEFAYEACVISRERLINTIAMQKYLKMQKCHLQNGK